MSYGFWFNILICICSLYGAWLDHGQTRDAAERLRAAVDRVERQIAEKKDSS